MKKSIIILSCVMSLLVILAGCAPPAPSADTGSQAPAADGNPDADDQLAAHIETLERGNSKIEYVVVTGLPDIAVQNALNAEIQFFYTWPLETTEESATVETTAEYSIIADTYISVRATTFIDSEGAAHPVNEFNTNTFDLRTGLAAGGLSDFVTVDEGLSEAITSGTFVQIYPDEAIEGAADTLAEEIVGTPVEYDIRFYLTETSLGLYLPERIHAEGDYWTFEAKYDDIGPLLKEKLTAVLGPVQ